jgi:hypothetical protein
MSRKYRDKPKSPPFVMLPKETMQSGAWRAMSPHARIMNIALRARFNHKNPNNGWLYLPTRIAARETGLSKDTAASGHRENEHYGFVVMTRGGCLGVDGKGKAPHWRLTDLPYMHEPPTKDFLAWNGKPFANVRGGRNWKPKKQNPVASRRTPCPTGSDIVVSDGKGRLAELPSDRTRHINDSACPTGSDKSRITISTSQKAKRGPGRADSASAGTNAVPTRRP